MRESLLNRINSPADLQGLTDAQLEQLVQEIRAFLVENLASTGGHLASNLGVAEITVALHLVLDTASDRLLFDVGHQSYVHKLLTGRRDAFPTLRQFGGLSGFPRPWDSPHDAFVAGHASAALSAALGMARARTLQGEHYHICTVIGDASFIGGMCVEALNDLGRSNEPLIIVLNDNGMSIAPSVGAMSSYLSRLRLKPGYFHLKSWVHKLCRPKAERFLHRLKQKLKKLLLPASMFEDLGITYIGPVDGHSIPHLCEAFTYARDLGKPVLVHCITRKGKGFSYTENEPSRYHGIVPFNAETGRTLRSPSWGWSDIFGKRLCQLAREDCRICAVTAGMPDGTGLRGFAGEFPDRFFDVGIAEEHAVAMCAGMARQGMIPVFAVYSTFLQRGYDQLLHDVAIAGLHVVFAVDRSGLVGADGETHQGLFDTGFLCQIPGITVFAPASEEELRSALETAVLHCDGPVAVRYPRGTPGAYRENHMHEPLTVLSDDGDGSVTLLFSGAMTAVVSEAAASLRKEGIPLRLCKLNRIKPFPAETFADACTARLLIAEEGSPHGGFGTQALAVLEAAGVPTDNIYLSTGDRFIPQGSVSQLRTYCGIDAGAVCCGVRELYGRAVPHA